MQASIHAIKSRNPEVHNLWTSLPESTKKDRQVLSRLRYCLQMMRLVLCVSEVCGFFAEYSYQLPVTCTVTTGLSHLHMLFKKVQSCQVLYLLHARSVSYIVYGAYLHKIFVESRLDIPFMLPPSGIKSLKPRCGFPFICWASLSFLPWWVLTLSLSFLDILFSGERWA